MQQTVAIPGLPDYTNKRHAVNLSRSETKNSCCDMLVIQTVPDNPWLQHTSDPGPPSRSTHDIPQHLQVVNRLLECTALLQRAGHNLRFAPPYIPNRSNRGVRRLADSRSYNYMCLAGCRVLSKFAFNMLGRENSIASQHRNVQLLMVCYVLSHSCVWNLYLPRIHNV